MGLNKLERFAEIKTFSNVFEYPENMKGTWNDVFNNHHPIILELACGKGEYAVGLGRLYANKNFIGIDLKGNRIWKGAKTALDEKLLNVAFIRSQIEQVDEYFNKNEIDEIWITFPDPQLRESKAKKRLTHPRFLRIYQNILKHQGLIHLKTDSPDLYEFTKKVINLFELELLQDSDNIYNSTLLSEDLKIKTHYESLDIAQSKKVHYLQFKINKELPFEKDILLKEINNGE
jgi:tRNA (guanine-N7-)-methyltransferase